MNVFSCGEKSLRVYSCLKCITHPDQHLFIKISSSKKYFKKFLPQKIDSKIFFFYNYFYKDYISKIFLKLLPQKIHFPNCSQNFFKKLAPWKITFYLFIFFNLFQFLIFFFSIFFQFFLQLFFHFLHFFVVVFSSFFNFFFNFFLNWTLKKCIFKKKTF